jgi:hypothetical protein
MVKHLRCLLLEKLMGASRFCKYPQISVKWVKSKETLKKSRERAMTQYGLLKTERMIN